MTSSVLTAAFDLTRRGHFVVPVPHREKAPKLRGWQDLKLTEATIPQHFNGHPMNIGLLLGGPDGLADVDSDCHEALALGGWLPPTGAIFGRAGKPYSHHLYKSPGITTTQYRDPTDRAMLIELRSTGAQTVVPPSTHPSGERIVWHQEGEPACVDGATLKAAVARIAAGALLARHWPSEGGRHEASLALAGMLARAGWVEEDVRVFVRGVAQAAGDDEWSKRENNVITTARRLDTDKPVTGRPTLEKLLVNCKGVLEKVREWLGIAQNDEHILVNAHQTDAGNAECMAFLFADHFRYCHTRGKWLYWNEARWKVDVDGEAQRAALQVARERQRAALTIEDTDRKLQAIKWGISSESTSRIGAMLEMAKSFRQFATTVELYDADPLLAGVENGTLDFRVGRMRPAERDEYLTMQLGTRADKAATAPRWEQFLWEVFAGDQELIDYVQRAVGYSLTGDTSEHVLFLCHGSGANGKSVFLEILTLLLGDYAANTPFDTFDAGKRGEATNDLAALKGKRLVTVIETEEDRRLAEARVKAVTGQDAVSCRFLYREFFTYRPQFKIWMAMNHKPIIRGTDRGIWRRVKLIPFTQSFEGREDRHLTEKLRAELSGILNWAITGFAAWLTQGLGAASAVEQATAEYRQESDLVGQWIEECTLQVPDAELSTKEAYTSYREWCQSYGHRELTVTAFGRSLKEKGYQKGSDGKQRYYIGIQLTRPLTGLTSLTGSSGNSPKENLSRETFMQQPVSPSDLSATGGEKQSGSEQARALIGRLREQPSSGGTTP